MEVEKKSLGQLDPLAEGGFGKVYRTGYHLPNDAADLVYKEFTRDHSLQAGSARAAVSFRDGLNPADKAELDSRTVWPRALVEEPRGTVKGLLMPLIPHEFFERMMDSDTGAMKDQPLEWSWLAASARQRAAAQLALRDVDKLERLVLLGKLIYPIAWLHKQGWVFGDVSFRNAVFTLDPPRVLLLDCDGAAPLSDRNRRQATTPFWEPPEFQPGTHNNLQDKRTDVYKLGLAILRCMAPGKGAASAKSPDRVIGALDAEGERLVADAVHRDPDKRPVARQLYDYFYRTVTAQILPPEVTMARLKNPYRVRGQDVRIDWQISNGTTVTVISGSQRLVVNLAQRPDGYAFRPDESGPVAIEVASRFGSIRVELGDVTLFEIPPFKVNFDLLPTPQVPRLPALPMAALDRVIAGAPGVRLPAIPAVPSLDTFGLIQALANLATLPVQLPPLGEAVADASAAASVAIQAEAEQMSASLRAAYLGAPGRTVI